MTDLTETYRARVAQAIRAANPPNKNALLEKLDLAATNNARSRLEGWAAAVADIASQYEDIKDYQAPAIQTAPAAVKELSEVEGMALITKLFDLRPVDKRKRREDTVEISNNNHAEGWAIVDQEHNFKDFFGYLLRRIKGDDRINDRRKGFGFHGSPGMGKTCLLQRLCKYLLEHCPEEIQDMIANFGSVLVTFNHITVWQEDEDPTQALSLRLIYQHFVDHQHWNWTNFLITIRGASVRIPFMVAINMVLTDTPDGVVIGIDEVTRVGARVQVVTDQMTQIIESQPKAYLIISILTWLNVTLKGDIPTFISGSDRIYDTTVLRVSEKNMVNIFTNSKRRVGGREEPLIREGQLPMLRSMLWSLGYVPRSCMELHKAISGSAGSISYKDFDWESISLSKEVVTEEIVKFALTSYGAYDLSSTVPGTQTKISSLISTAVFIGSYQGDQTLIRMQPWRMFTYVKRLSSISSGSWQDHLKQLHNAIIRFDGKGLEAVFYHMFSIQRLLLVNPRLLMDFDGTFPKEYLQWESSPYQDVNIRDCNYHVPKDCGYPLDPNVVYLGPRNNPGCEGLITYNNKTSTTVIVFECRGIELESTSPTPFDIKTVDEKIRKLRIPKDLIQHHGDRTMYLMVAHRKLTRGAKLLQQLLLEGELLSYPIRDHSESKKKYQGRIDEYRQKIETSIQKITTEKELKGFKDSEISGVVETFINIRNSLIKYVYILDQKQFRAALSPTISNCGPLLLAATINDIAENPSTLTYSMEIISPDYDTKRAREQVGEAEPEPLRKNQKLILDGGSENL